MTRHLLVINILNKQALGIVILKDQEVLIHLAQININGMLGIQLKVNDFLIYYKECLKMMPK